MANQVKVLVECEVCDGYGIHPVELGFGVLCARCHGSGGYELAYTLFTGLKKRTGIQRVRRSGRYRLSTPVEQQKAGVVGIPYADFLKGKRP